jgi:uncharacterized protein YndB with AHSA1/START domain
MTQPSEKAGTRAYEKRIEINAPVEAVWKALTDASELTRWFPPDARVTPEVGGSLWWSWGKEFEWESRIEIWEPNRHLRATYTSPPTSGKGTGEALPLVMDFYLEAQGGKTVLRLVHSGFGAGADWDAEYDGVRRGWEVELRSLRHYLENHRGRPRLVAWVRRRTDIPHAEAWKRFSSGQGLLRDGSLDGLREGDRYAISAATGDRFEGVVLFLGPPQDFSGTVETLNNALIRVHLEELLGVRHLWVWLAVYDLPQKEVDAFRDRWQTLLETLFPEK